MFCQSAELSGFVKDPSGKFVANALLQLREQNTGIRYQELTNTEGFYSFACVKPGAYEATCSGGQVPDSYPGSNHLERRGPRQPGLLSATTGQDPKRNCKLRDLATKFNRPGRQHTRRPAIRAEHAFERPRLSVADRTHARHSCDANHRFGQPGEVSPIIPR
jgi:Carboxypeptidase regulatory-like domain